MHLLQNHHIMSENWLRALKKRFHVVFHLSQRWKKNGWMRVWYIWWIVSFQVLTNWINGILKPEHIVVQSLQEDLYDGLVLHHLLCELMCICKIIFQIRRWKLINVCLPLKAVSSNNQNTLLVITSLPFTWCPQPVWPVYTCPWRKWHWPALLRSASWKWSWRSWTRD